MFCCIILFHSGKLPQQTDDFLKIKSLNKTKKCLIINKAKIDLLTLSSQKFFNSFKSDAALHIFTTNGILFQK